MNFCILGVHRRTKLFNIGEGEGSGMSSEVNFNAWGEACALQNIHTRMHAYIYTHLLYDWRESCLLIGPICLHKSLCLRENWSKLAQKVI